MIDSHCHLDHEPLLSDLSNVIQRSKDVGIEKLLTISTSFESFSKVKELINEDKIIYGTIGIHPHESSTNIITSKQIIENLNENSKIIGLIKPQFEAKKNELKKGIVKDNSVQRRICNDYINWFKEDENFEYIGLVESPIQGPKGNREFLIYTNCYKNLKQ